MKGWELMPLSFFFWLHPRFNKIARKAIHAQLAQGQAQSLHYFSDFVVFPFHNGDQIITLLALAPGGKILMEGYTPKQLELKTGGMLIPSILWPLQILVTFQDLRLNPSCIPPRYSETKSKSVAESETHQ